MDNGIKNGFKAPKDWVQIVILVFSAIWFLSAQHTTNENLQNNFNELKAISKNHEERIATLETQRAVREAVKEALKVEREETKRRAPQ